MIADRVGRRRARHLRWNTELAKAKRGNRRRDSPEKSASFCGHLSRRVQENKGMQTVIGMALLIVGGALMMFGMQASASLGSRLSDLFTGARVPT
jgi:hypothetical protein